MYTDIVLLYDFNSLNDRFLKEILLKYPCVPTLLPSISQEEHQELVFLFLFFSVIIFCAMQLNSLQQ